MKQHSMIFDDFFDNPNKAKSLCDEMPLMDYPASDGVVYPGIIMLPPPVEKEVKEKFKSIFGVLFKPQLIFGRYSLNTMNPPNWAHSDRNMASHLGLIYLSGSPVGNEHGTYMLRHTDTGMETHPQSSKDMTILLEDSNDKELWEQTYYCPAKFNRLFILNADYIHAAGKSFGSEQATGRLVISVFFNLEVS